MVRPKTYDEQLRAGLVRAAADRIAVNGAHGLSLRELAADQGTSTNAIYVMFGGKSQLVDAVLAQADAGFTHAQREALGAGRTLADLHRLGDAYRTWACANPAFYAAMFSHAGLAGGDSPQARTGDTPESMGPILTVIERLIADGLVRDGGVLPVATSVWAAVHGIVSLEIALWAGSPGADQIFATHMEAVERGWLTPRGQDEARRLWAQWTPTSAPVPVR